MKPIIFLLIFLSLSSFTSSQWVYQSVPANTSYYVCIEFSSVSNGAAGGVFLSSEFNGRGAYTTNAGQNWLLSTVPDSLRVITQIVFQASGTGYCSGAYNTTVFTNYVIKEHYNRQTLQPLKQYKDFSGNNNKGIFMRTTNSGLSWVPYGSLPSNVYYLLGLDFVDFNTAFAIASYDSFGGVNDGVIKTTNAGLTWSVLPMPEIINSLGGVYFIDNNTGFAYGYDVVNDTNRGVLLRTTNSGSNWSRQVFMQYGEFTGINFTNATTGLLISIANHVAGPLNTVILKTTNAGVNWSSVGNFVDSDLYDVKYVSGTPTALITGLKYLPGFESTDLILKTTNYGNNWLNISLNDTGLILFESKLFDLNNWYTAGGDFASSNIPRILHTTNGGAIGIQPISGEIPLSYSLSQNYPNPFNPVTIIGFDIPKSGNIKLQLFDLLGREVSALFDNYIPAGTYKIDFDAAALPAGVYFYRLTAENYSQTRKMILIK